MSTATVLLFCWLNKVTYQQPFSQGFFFLQVLGLQSQFSSHNCSLENCRSLFSMACSKGTDTVLVVRFLVCTLGFSLSPKIILDIASHSFSDTMSLPQAHKQIRTEEWGPTSMCPPQSKWSPEHCQPGHELLSIFSSHALSSWGNSMRVLTKKER